MGLPQQTFALVAFAFLAACEKPQQQAPAPPPTVEVVTLEKQIVANIIELPGRVQAIRVA